jgi:glucose dehydrogenase
VRRLLFKLRAGVGKRLICQRLGGCAIAVLAASASLSAAQERHTAPISSAIDVRAEPVLMRPVAADWPSYNGDYTRRRYSALAEITTVNVAQLRAHWVFHAPNSSGLETPVLLDAMFRGQPRKLIVQANRNRFLYVLDRTDGAFLSATRFVEKLNWASGIDAKGRPILTGVKPTEAGTRICPGFSGATNWYAPAFHPETGMFYFMALENCHVFLRKPKEFRPGQTYYSTGIRHSEGDFGEKVLFAYKLDSDKPAWRYVQAGDGRSSGGVMAMAGGLVFFGDDSQSFEAVDTQTGKALWHFNTGQTIFASPMSYAVNSKQYVAIAVGSDVFSFALP